MDEYSILGEGDYYPIRNYNNPPKMVDIKDIFNKVFNQDKEQTTNLNQEELENQKAIIYFSMLRTNDITFDYIDEVIKQAKKDNLNKLWIYQEIQKKWDLSLDHFKYVTFQMKDKISIAKELYRKYQLNMV